MNLLSLLHLLTCLPQKFSHSEKRDQAEITRFKKGNQGDLKNPPAIGLGSVQGIFVKHKSRVHCVPGSHLPAEVHLLCYAINQALGCYRANGAISDY